MSPTTMDRQAAEIVAGEATDDEDVAAFAEFFTRAWRESGPTAAGFTGATDEVIAALSAPDAVRERIGGPERRMFLAWDGSTAVGFSATRRIDDETVELAGIIVLESYSGRGIGSRLVDEAVSRAVAEGYRNMIVRTETTNHRARSFYEGVGFAVSGSDVENVEGTEVEVCELLRKLI